MISPRAPLIGLPTFRLSSWASSSVWSLMSAANFASVRPRLPAAQLAQPLRSSNAFWAAATARSTSSRPPSGAVAMTVPFGRVDDIERLAVRGIHGLAADDHAGRRGGGCGRSSMACCSGVMVCLTLDRGRSGTGWVGPR